MIKDFLDGVAHFIKELFDALNSKGGGIFISLLVFYSSYLMWLHSHEPQLLNIAIFSAGTLTGLAGGDRLANGAGTIQKTQFINEIKKQD